VLKTDHRTRHRGTQKEHKHVARRKGDPMDVLTDHEIEGILQRLEACATELEHDLSVGSQDIVDIASVKTDY